MSPKPKRRGKANSGSRKNTPAQSNLASGSAPAKPQAATGASPRPAALIRASGALKTPPRLDYVKHDLKKIAVTAASIVVIIIVLALVLPK